MSSSKQEKREDYTKSKDQGHVSSSIGLKLREKFTSEGGLRSRGSTAPFYILLLTLILISFTIAAHQTGITGLMIGEEDVTRTYRSEEFPDNLNLGEERYLSFNVTEEEEYRPSSASLKLNVSRNGTEDIELKVLGSQGQELCRVKPQEEESKKSCILPDETVERVKRGELDLELRAVGGEHRTVETPTGMAIAEENETEEYYEEAEGTNDTENVTEEEGVTDPEEDSTEDELVEENVTENVTDENVTEEELKEDSENITEEEKVTEEENVTEIPEDKSDLDNITEENVTENVTDENVTDDEFPEDNVTDENITDGEPDEAEKNVTEEDPTQENVTENATEDNVTQETSIVLNDLILEVTYEQGIEDVSIKLEELEDPVYPGYDLDFGLAVTNMPGMVDQVNLSIDGKEREMNAVNRKEYNYTWSVPGFEEDRTVSGEVTAYTCKEECEVVDSDEFEIDVEVTADKVQSQLDVFHEKEVERGEIFEPEVELYFENGTAIRNETVQLSVAEELYKLITDDDGVTSLNLNTSDLPAGSYTVDANFSGTKSIHGANTTTEFEVSEPPEEVDLLVQVDDIEYGEDLLIEAVLFENSDSKVNKTEGGTDEDTSTAFLDGCSFELNGSRGIGGEKLSFYIDGEFVGEEVTNSSGFVELEYSTENMVNREYDLRVEYQGEDAVSGLNKTSEFEVLPRIEQGEARVDLPVSWKETHRIENPEEEKKRYRTQLKERRKEIEKRIEELEK